MVAWLIHFVHVIKNRHGLQPKVFLGATSIAEIQGATQAVLKMMMMIIIFISVSILLAGPKRPTNRGHYIKILSEYLVVQVSISQRN